MYVFTFFRYRLIMLATRCPMRNTFDLFLNALQQDAMYRDLARDILARRDYLSKYIFAIICL